jgi:hypothetical protein
MARSKQDALSMIANTTCKIKTSTLPQALVKLRSSISGFEQSYGCTSEQMLKSVLSVETYETREIGTWLTDYHVLKRLEAQYGHMIGIRTVVS